jgi:ribonuclease HII
MAGVDEAGRGPLAGPVVAAAVIIDPRQPIAGVGDSKTLSASRRQRLAAEIIERATGWALGEATVEEIDEFNILGATLLAMKRAVAALDPAPELVLVDGPHCPPLGCATRGIIKGDASIASIGAASILAKVSRDAQMVELAHHYPGYGFERHKGYPTREHLRALAHLGASPQHRRSFRPVKQYLETLGTHR